MRYRYKEHAICNHCGRQIDLPRDTVIEWNEHGIRLCHFDCSTSVNNASALISTMELDSPMLLPDIVYDRLCELEQSRFGFSARLIRQDIFMEPLGACNS